MSTKISQLTNMTSVDLTNDVLPIVDVSEGTTKKIKPELLLEKVNENVKTLINTQWFSGDLSVDVNKIGYAELPIDIPEGYYLRGVFTQLETLGVSGITSHGKVGTKHYISIFNPTTNTQTYSWSATALFIKNV